MLFFIGLQIRLSFAKPEDSSNVKVWIQARQKDPAKRSMNFCLGCKDPSQEGSRVPVVWAGQGPSAYRVTGDLVYSIPNDANADRLLNARQLKGQVALVNRGEIPLAEKVLRLEKVGAAAVIIIDDGQCGTRLEHKRCGATSGGFAKHDRKQNWKFVTVPVLMISFVLGEKIKSMMNLTEMVIKGIPMPQFVHAEL